MKEIVVRVLVGGLVVTAFSLISDLLKPKSFAGLFGAAPSVALATLGLTVVSKGRPYVALEARSMVLGASAFFVYASLISWMLMHRSYKALWIALGALPVWFTVAFGLWGATLK